VTASAEQALTLYARFQEIPPYHRGGCALGRDELVLGGIDYDQALPAARCQLPASPRAVDHRAASPSVNQSPLVDRSGASCARR
jgi:hypothetical protein